MDVGVIEARGLVKVYPKDQRAVDGLALTVERGEIYGFLGPNGAGKTTAIKMILGLAKPTNGHARLFGHDVWEAPKEARADVGFLPETLSFYKTLTGRETLRFFADLKGVAREEVDERLAAVGLSEAMDKRVGAYSRGMTQRLGLAQALLGSPKLLVLDEPTTGLDPVGARQVKDVLRKVNGAGTTILFSSHILSEVQELAKRVGVIRRGRMVAEDTVDALRSRLAMRGTLRLTLDGEAPAGVEEAVRAVPGVADARVKGSVLEVACEPASRLRAAEAAERAGARVVNLETSDASLEDVFMKLATDDAPEVPA